MTKELADHLNTLAKWLRTRPDDENIDLHETILSCGDRGEALTALLRREGVLSEEKRCS